MSNRSKKRKGSQITPPKSNPASSRRKLSENTNSPDKMAASPRLHDQNKTVPWKENQSRTIAIEVIETLKGNNSNLSEQDESLIRVLLNAMEERVNASLEFMNQTVETLNAQLTKAKQDIYEVEIENQTLKQDMDTCKREMEKMDNTQLEAETYSRLNNLQISGPGVTKEKVGYNSDRLRSWFRYVLNSLGCKHVVPIERIHWLRGSDSTIIIRFKHYSDREDFWNERRHFGSKFRNMYVSEDFPKKVVEARKVLVPICKEAKLQMANSKPKVVRDRLVLGENSYTVKDLDKLPKCLQQIRNGCKESEDAHVFFTKHSVLSNHAMTDIRYEGRIWTSVEQYWMYHKAKEFDDKEIMKEVLETDNPVKQKSLGRSVKNCNMTVWKDKVPEIIFPILMEKFKQNEGPRKILLDTGSKRLGEATTERYWGVGMKLADPNVLDVGRWKGENIVGNLLEKVRTKLTQLGY